VRAQVLRLVSLPLWHALSRGRLQLELHAQPQLAKHWRHLAKKEAKAAAQEGHVPVQSRPEATFVPALLSDFLAVLADAVPAEHGENGGAAPMEQDGAAGDAGGAGGAASPRRQAVLYCERFVEFLTDLLTQVGARLRQDPGPRGVWVGTAVPGALNTCAAAAAVGALQASWPGSWPPRCPVCHPLLLNPGTGLGSLPAASPLTHKCSCPRAALCTPCWRTEPSWSSATCPASTPTQTASSSCRWGARQQQGSAAGSHPTAGAAFARLPV
jgi:hypothetical protein